MRLLIVEDEAKTGEYLRKDSRSPGSPLISQQCVDGLHLRARRELRSGRPRRHAARARWLGVLAGFARRRIIPVLFSDCP